MKDSDFMNVMNLTRLRDARVMLSLVCASGPLKPFATDLIEIHRTIDTLMAVLDDWADAKVRA